MKKILLIFLALSISVIGQEKTKSSSIDIDILEIPESVMIHDGMLYISNLGDPDELGDGFIVQANLDGSDAKKLFENQLDSPKGFTFISDDLIVISDQVNNGSQEGNVVLANIKSGEIISKIIIEDSKFLNDVAFIDNKTVALTDTGANKVYTISISGDKMKYKEIADDIAGANGIIYSDKMLYIAGSIFGGDSDGGNLYTMNTKGGKKKILTKKPIGTGGLDGIGIIGDMLYVSDWGDGVDNGSYIYMFDLEKNMLVARMKGYITSIADFYIDDDFLWVPEFLKNNVKKIKIPK